MRAVLAYHMFISWRTGASLRKGGHTPLYTRMDGLCIISQKDLKFAEGVEVDNNNLFEMPKLVNYRCLWYIGS
jgi:hypothetical protein